MEFLLLLHGMKTKVVWKQVGRSGRAAFEFIQVNHFQAVACARVVRLAFCRTHCGAQSQPPDTPHSVDTNFHMHLFTWLIFQHLLKYCIKV